MLDFKVTNWEETDPYGSCSKSSDEFKKLAGELTPDPLQYSRTEVFQVFLIFSTDLNADAVSGSKEIYLFNVEFGSSLSTLTASSFTLA
jgi:hypothetical protein